MIQFDEQIFQMGWNHQLRVRFLTEKIKLLRVVRGVKEEGQTDIVSRIYKNTHPPKV